MTIIVRCREDKLYQYKLATANFTQYGVEVTDREEAEHFFPYANMIHMTMRQDGKGSGDIPSGARSF